MQKHSKEYEDYIRSWAWKQKRQQRLEIDGHCCSMCGKPENECRGGLQIHHVHYNSLGNEDPYNDICSLCARCHGLIHSYYRRKRA